MDEPLHDIDKLFLDNIRGHTEHPPKKVWDHIEAGLDKSSAVIYKRKYEKTRRAAFVLLLLITGILVYEIVAVRGGRNSAAENTAKYAGDKKVAAQERTTKDEVTGSPQSDERTLSPSATDSTAVPGQNGSTPDNQTGKIEIDKAINPAGPVVVPQRNTIRVPEKDNQGVRTATMPLKNKAVQPVQGTERVAHRDEPVRNVDITNTQQPDKKEQEEEKNKTGGSKDKIQKTPSLVVLPETENRRVAPIARNEEPQPVVSRASAKILQQAVAYSLGHYLEWPLTAMDNKSTKEQIKAARKIFKANAVQRGLYLSLYVSPNIAWNSLENDEPHHSGSGGNRVEDHDAIKRGEHGNFSYTGGMKLSYNINKNIAVQSGFNYTSFSTSISPKLIFADQDNNGDVRYRLDCSSGYSFLLPGNAQQPSTGDSVVATNSRNSLAYAGIPLTVEYKLIAGKIGLSAMAGGQANILLKGKTTATFAKGTSAETSASGSTQALKSTYFSAVTGITGEFRLTKKLSVTLSPMAQFGLSAINKGGSVKTRSNYFSAAAGLKLKL